MYIHINRYLFVHRYEIAMFSMAVLGSYRNFSAFPRYLFFDAMKSECLSRLCYVHVSPSQVFKVTLLCVAIKFHLFVIDVFRRMSPFVMFSKDMFSGPVVWRISF